MTEITLKDNHNDNGRSILLKGDMTIITANNWRSKLNDIAVSNNQPVIINMKGVRNFDTTGAWLIYSTKKRMEKVGANVTIGDVTEKQTALILHVGSYDTATEKTAPTKNKWLQSLATMGASAIALFEKISRLLEFLGVVVLGFIGSIRHPGRIRWNAMTTQFEEIGLKALPIVGLLSFLIGLVLVQQGAVELKQFGAEVFVVDLVGISTIRELGVLICAIMVAGRSGSAFTAQIGSMKLEEEVDAMQTIGLDPIDVLIMPRVFALFILMPLLGFYASMMSLAGGALLSYIQLGIPLDTFIERLRDVITVKTFLVGILKAPVFGVIIAVVGCFEGMQVEGGAQSVGEHTTASVVASIFLVIVSDAFFAVFFTAIDW